MRVRVKDTLSVQPVKGKAQYPIGWPPPKGVRTVEVVEKSGAECAAERDILRLSSTNTISNSSLAECAMVQCLRRPTVASRQDVEDHTTDFGLGITFGMDNGFWGSGRIARQCKCGRCQVLYDSTSNERSS